MSQGRLIAVVGPSGVGKDSVMLGLHAALPGLHLVRRVITRAPGQGGEDYDAVPVPKFQKMADAGAFLAHWGAHGLFYGIPQGVTDTLGQGTDCLANFSRTALATAAARVPRLLVLNITARPETLARRLADRRRESAAQIAARLAEADKPLPEGLAVIHISNDGPLTDTVAEAARLLRAPAGLTPPHERAMT